MSGGLRTAVRLLSALERVPTAVPSIGALIIPAKLDIQDDFAEEKEPEEPEEGAPLTKQQRAEKLYAVLSDAYLKSVDAPAVVAAGSEDILKMAELDGYQPPAANKSPPVSTFHLQLRLEPDAGTTVAVMPAKKHKSKKASGGNVATTEEDSPAAASSPSNRDTPPLYSDTLLTLPKSLLQQLWKSAALSPFGLVASQETKVDSTVRNARELSAESGQVRVEPKLLKRLAQLWGQHMLPRAVRVEAYKLNVYGPGGHFAPHRDTPAAGLVGTILVGLADTSDDASGLQLWSSQHKALEGAEADLKSLAAGVAASAHATAASSSDTAGSSSGSDGTGASVVWRSRPGSVLMFYPDVTHAVLPITSGTRATLAFKVFIDSEPNADGPGVRTVSQCNQADLRKRMVATLKECDTPYALLLNHYYTQEAAVEQLRGSDALLYSLLQEVGGLSLSVIPVLLRVGERGPNEDYGDEEQHRSWTAEGIYPVTEEVIEAVSAMKEQKKGSTQTIPRASLPTVSGVDWSDEDGKEPLSFFPLSNFLDPSKRLFCTLKSHGGYGGNDSCPSEAQSIYLHRAIIVRRAEESAQSAAAAAWEDAAAPAAHAGSKRKRHGKDKSSKKEPSSKK